ncbi:TraR/DksA C4-type zinc finger protein [Virgibacillus sp. Bac330]|uniref:TraR/DksA C4-type zinc finger protein n=1 Tax=Virgibacillus sp. Bac330 TaxID=2419841 RepID=UPI000EF4A3BE|nr:TraR/DksA C4-type zinc finger protein [Virgibacillus sp. Bac330]
MINEQQLANCKQALQNRQSELISHVQEHTGLTLESVQQSSGELSNYDNHPADTASELFERGKDVALNEHAEKELEDINKALHAIAEGTYGICKECGNDIPYERLEALPTADRCMEHTVQDSFNQTRTMEEEVYSPNINPDKISDETQVGYDAEDAWQEVSRYGTSETSSDFYGDKASYNKMYPNSDEQVGYVEDVEGYLGASSDGKYTEPVMDQTDDEYER